MTTAFPARTLTQEELWAEATDRFGENSREWAFQCPGCGDIATGTDVIQALKDKPREHPRGHDREGRPVTWNDVLGRECIGRILGKDAGRGCQYAAFGFIHGPWTIAIPYYRKPVYSFPLAPAPAAQSREKATRPAAKAPAPRVMAPAAAERLPRPLKHIQNKGRPVRTADVHRVYISWGWKGLNRSQTRGDLAALADAGHLRRDDSSPGGRVYRPVRTSRGGDAT